MEQMNSLGVNRWDILNKYEVFTSCTALWMITNVTFRARKLKRRITIREYVTSRSFSFQSRGRPTFFLRAVSGKWWKKGTFCFGSCERIRRGKRQKRRTKSSCAIRKNSRRNGEDFFLLFVSWIDKSLFKNLLTFVDAAIAASLV